jgi:hypothetical protein
VGHPVASTTSFATSTTVRPSVAIAIPMGSGGIKVGGHSRTPLQMKLQRSADLPARQPGQDGRVGSRQYHPDGPNCPTQRTDDQFVLKDTHGVHVHQVSLADGGVIVPKGREVCFGESDAMSVAGWLRIGRV